MEECVIWDHDAAGSSPVTPMGENLPNIKKMPKMWEQAEEKKELLKSNCVFHKTPFCQKGDKDEKFN